VADAEATVEHAFAKDVIHPIRLIKKPEAGLRRYGRSRPFWIADHDKFASFTTRNTQFDELRQRLVHGGAADVEFFGDDSRIEMRTMRVNLR